MNPTTWETANRQEHGGGTAKDGWHQSDLLNEDLVRPVSHQQSPGASAALGRNRGFPDSASARAMRTGWHGADMPIRRRWILSDQTPRGIHGTIPSDLAALFRQARFDLARRRA